MPGFHPADWRPARGGGTALFNQVRPMFQKFGADVVGIPVDKARCHGAFVKHHLHLPLPAGFEPKGAVARACGVCHQAGGLCERALLVTGKHGIIAWSCCLPMAVTPGADGIMTALQRLPD